MSEKIRLGLIGLGNMGRVHAVNLLAGKVPRIELTAVAETNPEKLAEFPGLKAYPSFEAMAQAGGLDAVLIALDITPDGITLAKAGKKVGVEWRKLVRPAKELVEAGLVAKKETQYFPN